MSLVGTALYTKRIFIPTLETQFKTVPNIGFAIYHGILWMWNVAIVEKLKTFSAVGAAIHAARNGGRAVGVVGSVGSDDVGNPGHHRFGIVGPVVGRTRIGIGLGVHQTIQIFDPTGKIDQTELFGIVHPVGRTLSFVSHQAEVFTIQQGQGGQRIGRIFWFVGSIPVVIGNQKGRIENILIEVIGKD